MRLPVFVSCLLATPALSECPVAADMAAGVRLTETNGNSETFTVLPNGFVRAEWVDEDGYGAKYLLKQGIYVVEAFDLEDGELVSGTRATYTYAEEPPELVAGTRWDVQTVIYDIDGISAGSESHIYGPPTQTSIGSCTYDIVPIISIYHGPDGYEEKVNYIPELGFAYLIETKDPGQKPELYTYASIKPL